MPPISSPVFRRERAASSPHSSASCRGENEEKAARQVTRRCGQDLTLIIANINHVSCDGMRGDQLH